MKQKTCFKNPEKPFCIDRLLVAHGVFKTLMSLKRDSSDFGKLTFTVLKQYFPKQKSKVLLHRQYKNFRYDLFRSDLENALFNPLVHNIPEWSDRL